MIEADNTKRLNEILKTMDIPEGRIHDTFWLRRNLMFNNKDHPDFEEAIRILKQVSK
jgi:hypothetical protein